MKLTAALAKSQLKTNKSRTVWALFGIVLATAMITAVYGFVVTGFDLVSQLIADSPFRNIYYTTLLGIGAVLTGFIVVASVVVVSNTFRVSAGERTAQFGILKSAGATSRQITHTVLYEGVYLSALGIPLGLLTGLLIHFVGVSLIDGFFTGMQVLDQEAVSANFILSPPALLLSALVAFATVLLSAWIPARKAAKLPAISAIRGEGEIQIKEKPARGNWLLKTLFGFEGTLASKSLKRSRRNFRATVLSLSFSVALFITAGAFFLQMERATGMVWPGVEATAVANFFSHWETVYGEDGEVVESRAYTIDSAFANDVTQRFRAYTNAPVFGVGSDHRSYRVSLPAEMMTPRLLEIVDPLGENSGEHRLSAVLVSVDEENYALLAERAGAPLGSNILINNARHRFSDGRRTEFAPLVFSGQSLTLIRPEDDSQRDLPLHGALSMAEVPHEVLELFGYHVLVLVPELSTMSMYRWFSNSPDPEAFVAYAHDHVLYDIRAESEANIFAVNLEREEALMRDMARLIMTLTYGFVALLTLIGLTNVISTISANVRARAMEFAVLRSVGMSHGGLSRMLRLESLLCSFKALLFGIPLGIALSYAVHHFIIGSVDFAYELPWLIILQCVLGVVLLTWGTMHHAAKRLRGQSIVDSIRAGSAM